MKRKTSRIVIIIILCLFPIWMYVCKDKQFSVKENRYLASAPALSITSITDGSFMKDYETYLTDQFPVRDACVSIKASILRCIGQKMINNVYIGKDGYLIAKESSYKESDFLNTIDSINSFKERCPDIDVNVMAVPNSVYILKDKLPYGVTVNQDTTLKLIQDNLIEDINYIDVSSVLEENDDIKLFYKTDHHWTTRAAYLAFKEYERAKEIDSDMDYHFYTVTGSFQGTQASDTGIYSKNDVVEICVPENAKGSYVVNYVDSTTKKTTLFDEAKLNEKDKYLVFMGGNYAETDIKTNAATGKRLLVIKDSFANCMIPMLTPLYDEIVVIDPRYYYNDIYELIKSQEINEVLFLYNVNSFVTDNSLQDVLK